MTELVRENYLRQLFALVAGLCSAFFLFYTIRLVAVTRYLTQHRPGGGDVTRQTR